MPINRVPPRALVYVFNPITWSGGIAADITLRMVPATVVERWRGRLIAC